MQSLCHQMMSGTVSTFSSFTCRWLWWDKGCPKWGKRYKNTLWPHGIFNCNSNITFIWPWKRKLYGTIWEAGWRARNASRIRSKTSLYHLEMCLKYEKAFLNLLTAKECNFHNITDSSWTVNGKNQVVTFQYKLIYALSWGKQSGDAVKMRWDAHPEFQKVAEVLSRRWIGCRCQNKGSLKNCSFSAKGKCDLPLHRVWHTCKIYK